MKYKKFLQILLVLCTVLFVTGTAAAAPDGVILVSEDTVINLTDADNPQNALTLATGYSETPFAVPPEYHNVFEIYLKFDISGLTANVGPATELRLNVFIPSLYPMNVELFSYDDDSWTEGGLTWNIAKLPSNLANVSATGLITNTMVGTYQPGVEFGWMKFQGQPIADFINQQRVKDGTASFILRFKDCGPCIPTDGVYFWDYEFGAAENRQARIMIYGPTAVDVASFDARPEFGRVALDWQTYDESSLSGFNLYRAETLNGARQRVNREMILAQHPGGTGGGEYQLFDYDIRAGQTYYYWLERVDALGEKVSQGPAVVNTLRWLFFPLLRK